MQLAVRMCVVLVRHPSEHMMLGECRSLRYDSLGRNMQNNVCFSSVGGMNLRLESSLILLK